ncbi:hypothetical protein Tco_1135339 [Tanacetum coccineum]
MNDDTPVCERHEANYIQSEGHHNRISHDSYSHQTYHDPYDSEKLLTELNNDVRNDLEDFKRCIHSMRNVHWKLFKRDDQSKTDFEKSITKFLDGQSVTNMKIDEGEKSQNISSEQTERTDPPPPQAHTEEVNVVFTGSEKFDYSLKILKDPPPPIIVNNKIKKDKPIKTSKKGYHVSYVSIPSLRMCTYGLCRLLLDIGISIKLYEWASNLVAPELVLDHHLLDRSEVNL